MSKIHGHEVLEMMLASQKTYTKTSLTEEIVAKFGAAARFYTCSADNLTAADLVEFLDRKGKLVGKNGGLQTAPELFCRH